MSLKSVIIAVATAFSASACSNLGLLHTADQENPEANKENIGLHIKNVVPCDPLTDKSCFGGDFPLKPKN